MTHTLRLADDAAGIAQAAGLLRAGKLVAFGTETVYGLGGDATDDHAIAALYAAKDRPSFNPLICHVPDADAAWALVASNDLAQRLAAQFWPGPLTLVLPHHKDCAVGQLAGAGLDTLAVRVPAAQIARSLLRAVGRPVAAPSANRSGRISPTTADHVLEELDGRIDAVLDSGPAVVGLESTVIDLSGDAPVLLRAGGVKLEDLLAVTGPMRKPSQIGNTPKGPGLLASHYAPALPVRLNADAAHADEALLAFGPASAAIMVQLSETRDVAEAASNLFAGLRRLDTLGRAGGLRGIAVMPVPCTGLGLAINDRLQRAAAPRPSPL